MKYEIFGNSCVCVLSALALCLLSPEAPVSKPSQGYTGGPRIQRQEQVIHLSPKKGSQVRCYICYELFVSTIRIQIVPFSVIFLFGLQSDGHYSGHSGSNTLSSTTSSGGHSDSDKWYEMGGGGGPSGDQAESEPNGLGGGGYLQGASADSGIDTSSFGAPHLSHSHSHHGSTTSLLAPSGGREGRERSVSPWHSPTEGGRRMLERSPAAAESSGPPGERSLDGTGRTPPTHLLIRDGSTYSLSDTGSHPRLRVPFNLVILLDPTTINI